MENKARLVVNKAADLAPVRKLAVIKLANQKPLLACH
jgi:hypothetical protein